MVDLQVRPHSLGDILGASFTIGRSQFGPLIAVGFLLVFVPFVVSAIGGCTHDANLDHSCDSVIGWIGLAGTYLGSAGATAAASIVAVATYAGMSPNWNRAVRSGIRSIIPINVALFAVGLAMAVPLIAWIFLVLVITGSETAAVALALPVFWVPAIFVEVSFVVFIPALVVERRGIIKSLRRSWHLVSGERWRLLGVELILLIIAIIAALIVGFAVWWLLGLAGLSDGDASYYSQEVIGTLFAPLVGVVLAVFYVDLRARQEDLDAAGLKALLPGVGRPADRPNA